jgi:DNA (cytosine-5)-methyltransferase 1
LAQSSTGSGAPGYSNQEIFSQNCANLVPQPVPIQDGREIEKRQNGLGVGQPGDPAYTVDTTAAQAVAFAQNQREEVREVEVPGALAAEPGTHQQTYIAQPVPYDLFQITAPVNRQNRKPGDPCHTLARDNAAHATVAFTVDMQACKGNANIGNGTVSPTLCKPSGNDVHAVAIGTDCYNGAITGDVAATMGTPGSSVNASGPTVMQAVAFKTGNSAKARSNAESSEVTPTLGSDAGGNTIPAVAFHPLQDPISSTDGSTHCMGTGGSQGHASIAVATAMTVRRLSAEECEALQGFSRGWTRIPWRGKPVEQCPDGPRYKALGNSMACNCMAWIGEKIAKWEADHA